MKERLQQFMSEEGLSPAQLADILEIQRSGLSHILSGRNKPSYDFINKLVTNFPNINIMWLITGNNQEVVPPKEGRASLFENNASLKISELEPYPSKSEIKKEERVVIGENEKVEKILVIYNDGTFEEIKRRP
ncbi:MAG: helix-turn-helix transcriptional regulator [Bacteroidales bacterium]